MTAPDGGLWERLPKWLRTVLDVGRIWYGLKGWTALLGIGAGGLSFLVVWAIAQPRWWQLTAAGVSGIAMLGVIGHVAGAIKRKRVSSVQNPRVGTLERVLWVDDRPENVAAEIARLRSRGVEVIHAGSTSEALSLVLTNAPSLSAVVSDMVRVEGGNKVSRAGLNLKQALDEAGVRCPFYVLTTANRARLDREAAIASGVDGITGSSVQLMDWLMPSESAGQ